MSGPYNQQYGYAQNGYYNNQYQAQSSYPSGGFSDSYQQPYHNPQNYYPDTRAPSYPENNYGQPGANQTYYDNNGQPVNGQSSEADRGLLGAAAGGAAGAFGGHKVGHGVLGALGGAILGSLTEDFAKKKNKGKHSKRDAAHGQSYASGGLSNSVSGFFNKK
jgi:hypothetical protein